MVAIRAFVLLVALLSGCRFGAFAGSTHGRGTTPVGTASFSTGEYEMTSDVVLHRVVILTGLGLSDVGARMRLDSNQAIDHTDNGLDFIASAGLGYDVVQTKGLHVTAYGMFTKGFGATDASTLGTRYTAGLELGGVFGWRFELVVRAGVSRASASYLSNLTDPMTFEQIAYDVSPTVFMLEVGIGLDGSDFKLGDD